MALKRRDMPLSSFDPRYRDIILAGCRERVEIVQQSRADAKRLAHLLTTYRARMKRAHEDSPDKWEPLYGAIIGVSPDGLSTVVRPRDQEADHLLRDIRVGGAPAALDEIPTLIGLEPSAFDHDPLAEFIPVRDPNEEE